MKEVVKLNYEKFKFWSLTHTWDRKSGYLVFLIKMSGLSVIFNKKRLFLQCRIPSIYVIDGFVCILYINKLHCTVY